MLSWSNQPAPPLDPPGQPRHSPIVAFEENSARIVANAATFDWNLPELEKRRLFFLDARIAPDAFRAGDLDLGGLLAAIDGKAAELSARRLVLDGLDVLLSMLDEPAAERRELLRLAAWLQERRLTTIVTAKAPPDAAADGIAPGHYSLLPFLVDAMILLQHGITDRVARRELRVFKYRGSAFSENAAPMAIGPQGVEAPSPNPEDADTRRSGSRPGSWRSKPRSEAGISAGAPRALKAAPGDGRGRLTLPRDRDHWRRGDGRGRNRLSLPRDRDSERRRDRRGGLPRLAGRRLVASERLDRLEAFRPGGLAERRPDRIAVGRVSAKGGDEGLRAGAPDRERRLRRRRTAGLPGPPVSEKADSSKDRPAEPLLGPRGKAREERLRGGRGRNATDPPGGPLANLDGLRGVVERFREEPERAAPAALRGAHGRLPPPFGGERGVAERLLHGETRPRVAEVPRHEERGEGQRAPLARARFALGERARVERPEEALEEERDGVAPQAGEVVLAERLRSAKLPVGGRIDPAWRVDMGGDLRVRQADAARLGDERGPPALPRPAGARAALGEGRKRRLSEGEHAGARLQVGGGIARGRSRGRRNRAIERESVYLLRKGPGRGDRDRSRRREDRGASGGGNRAEGARKRAHVRSCYLSHQSKAGGAETKFTPQCASPMKI